MHWTFGRVTARDAGQQRGAIGVVNIDEFVTADVVGRLGDALILMTTDGTFLEANAAALDLYGYTRDEMITLCVSDIRAPRFREHIPAAFRGVTGRARTFETEHVRHDGTTFPVEVRTIEVANGDGSVVLAAIRDITHRQDAEASQRVSDVRFDNIAATIPGVLYEYAPKGAGRGLFTFVGPGSYELLGIDALEMQTEEEAFWRRIHPDDLEWVLAEDEATEGEGVTFRIDCRIITPVGVVKWIHMASRQLPSRPNMPDIWCGFMLDITERKEAEARLLRRDEEMARLNAELARVAASDALTGLASRRHFYEVLDREIGAIDRHGGLLCVVSFDLDGLKRVNDTQGHGAGDEVLTIFARILEAECLAGFLCGRIGGDEFSVVLPGEGADSGRAFAERVIKAVRSCSNLSGASVTVSGGVAEWTPGSESDDLLRRADVALYSSKRVGGNNVNR